MTIIDGVRIPISNTSLSVLLEIFEQHQHDGRVILPLLKSIRLLMDRLCIDMLIRNESFSSSLLRLLGTEESLCKDVHRLTALIDVALGLLSPDNPGQKVCGMAMI